MIPRHSPLTTRTEMPIDPQPGDESGGGCPPAPTHPLQRNWGEAVAPVRGARNPRARRVVASRFSMNERITPPLRCCQDHSLGEVRSEWGSAVKTHRIIHMTAGIAQRGARSSRERPRFAGCLLGNLVSRADAERVPIRCRRWNSRTPQGSSRGGSATSICFETASSWNSGDPTDRGPDAQSSRFTQIAQTA